jgi:hypothetical protein
MRTCSIEGCNKKHDAKGYCKTHGSRFYRNGDPLLNLRRDPEYNFHKNYTPVPESGCWLWLGSLNLKGYGRLMIKKKSVLAHRFSWEHHNGPISKGLLVCHKCDTPSCVNPDHLFIGTHADNLRDMRNKGRWKRKTPVKVTPKCPTTGKFIRHGRREDGQ